MPKPRTRSTHPFVFLAITALAFALFITACGTSEDSEATATPLADTATAVPAATTALAEQPAGAGVAVTLQEGTTARYLIREELASVDLPFDAIGETSDVSGTFTFTPDGAVVPGSSRMVLNAASLRSDEENRDRYLSRNAIQTATYPEIVFVPTRIDGLAWPLPTSGDAEFMISGDLTVRDVTRPVTWQTTATFDGAGVTGTAKTNFTFGDFEMEVPDLFFIVSLEDNIRLELDFVAGW